MDGGGFMLNDFVLKRVEISNGETIAYRECGQGRKTIVLIHGNMTSSKHWDILMEELKDDYKIYAIDLRGFGGSSYNHSINSLKDFAEDINEFTNVLGIDKYSAIGWSTGGGVALELAANYPDNVEKVVLVESVGVKGYPMFKKDDSGAVTAELLKEKEDIAKDPLQVVPALMALEAKNKEYYRSTWNMLIYTHNQPTPEKYEEYLEDMLTQRNLVDVDYALVHFNMTNESNGVASGTDTAKNISAPVLILQGDRDYVVPMYMAQDTNNHVKTSTIRILKDCGHSPLVDCLNELVSEVKDFI